MKIQILLDGQLVGTQIVSEEIRAVRPSLSDAKLMALKAAIEDRQVTISQSLRVTFRLFDVLGKRIEED
jgi:hypothetical protein